MSAMETARLRTEIKNNKAKMGITWVYGKSPSTKEE